MNEITPQFPDYGDHGDISGVRRARRSFRLVVISLVAITIMLWVCEQFLLHDEAERNYIAALTHEKTSARVFLLQAIKIDAAEREEPTPKYSGALAGRSESDIIISRYRTAHEMDRANALFSIRYGALLYRLKRYPYAIEQFVRAGEQPQENSFPLYLEAATIAAADETDRDAIARALVKVAAANRRDEPLVFPRPFWYSGYDQDGDWYARLSRGIVDEVLAPLYGLSQIVVDDVARQIDQSQFQNARTWLGEILDMGERLAARSDPPGTVQAIAALTIQLQALDLLERLGSPMNGIADEALIERRLRTTQALDLMREFEETREERIAAQSDKYHRPLSLLVRTMAVLIGLHLSGLFLYRLLRFMKSRWTVPHSRLGKTVLTGGSLSFLGLLCLITLMQQSSTVPAEAVGAACIAWNVVLCVMVVFGMLYPAITLKSVEEVSKRSGRLEDMELTVRKARQSYRRAYASLSLRYYGILSGVTACVVCVWVIGYRITLGLYPWQFKLLTTGLLDLEREVVEKALALLG